MGRQGRPAEHPLGPGRRDALVTLSPCLMDAIPIAALAILGAALWRGTAVSGIG